MAYNKSYHRYFEGYVEREIINSKGKKRIERTYAGDWFRHDMPDAGWKRLKLKFGLLTLWTLAVCLVQGTLSFGGSASVWYVAGLVGLTFAVEVWLAYVAVCYIAAPRDMELHQYRDRTSFKNTRMIAAIPYGLTGLGQILMMIFHRENLMLSLVMFLADVSCCAVLRYMYVTERDMPYTRTKSNAKASDGSYDIRYKTDRELGD